MNNFSDILKSKLNESKFNLSDTSIDKFVEYANLLLEWNSKMNLTAITQPEDIAVKHFIDSLMVLEAFDIPQGAKVIDVGTGAGFPGVPLKIVRPDIELTLLDSLNKRLIFLDNLLSSINIKANLVHARAEEAARKIEFRETFDVAVSRAVAPLNILLEYCMPFVKVNGVFIASKGSNANTELKNAENAINLLNVNIENIKSSSLIELNDRNIIVFKKSLKISNIYPRHGSKISKKPL